MDGKCRVCLKVITDTVVGIRLQTNESKMKSLAALFPSMDMEIIADSFLCNDCAYKLDMCYEFKLDIISKTAIKSSGNKIYICKICSKFIVDLVSNISKNVPAGKFSKMCKEVFGKVVSPHAITICDLCWDIFKTTYMFVSLLYETEKTIITFCRKNNLRTLNAEEFKKVVPYGDMESDFMEISEMIDLTESCSDSEEMINHKNEENVSVPDCKKFAEVENALRPSENGLETVCLNLEKENLEYENSEETKSFNLCRIESYKSIIEEETEEILNNSLRPTLETSEEDAHTQVEVKHEETDFLELNNLELSVFNTCKQEIELVEVKNEINDTSWATGSGDIFMEHRHLNAQNQSEFEHENTYYDQNYEQLNYLGLYKIGPYGEDKYASGNNYVLQESSNPFEKRYAILKHQNETKMRDKCTKTLLKSPHYKMVPFRTKQTKFECAHCPFTCRYRVGMCYHMKNHSFAVKESKFECAHCPYTSTVKAMLRVHMKLHLKTFFTLRNLRNSSTEDHNKPGIKNLNALLKSHNELWFADKVKTKETTFQCAHCAYTSTLKGNIMAHMKLHSKKCFTFRGKRKRSRKNELMKETSEAQNGISFPNKVRTKESTYECAHCPYITTARMNFTQHMKFHSKTLLSWNHLIRSCSKEHNFKNKNVQRENQNDIWFANRVKTKELFFECAHCSFNTNKRGKIYNHLRYFMKRGQAKCKTEFLINRNQLKLKNGGEQEHSFKKRGRPRKEVFKSEKIKNHSSKKRGRPKKEVLNSETVKNHNCKKRGRPRKEVFKLETVNNLSPPEIKSDDILREYTASIEFR